MSKDTLVYVGVTPSLAYWKDTSSKKYDKTIPIEEYDKLYNKNWSLRDECIKYLNKDLESLLNIMDRFNKYIFRNYDIQMTDCATISILALNIYQVKFVSI